MWALNSKYLTIYIIIMENESMRGIFPPEGSNKVPFIHSFSSLLTDFIFVVLGSTMHVILL